MFEITFQDLRKVFIDIAGGLTNWRLWHLLAWQEIKQRYRRSTLGPLWMTVSMGVTMATMGVVVSWLFNHSFERFLPFISISIIMWTMITGIITEGANCFIGAVGYITQIRRPLTTYILQMIWRNIITLGHNFLVFVVVSFIFVLPPQATALILFVSFPLVLLNLTWVALVLAILSARFRDIPVIIQNVLTVVFWLTPIIYYPDQLTGLKKTIIVDLNPLAHMLELIRAPLMGDMPTALSWIVTIGLTIVGWTFAILFFARFRARVPFWM